MIIIDITVFQVQAFHVKTMRYDLNLMKAFNALYIEENVSKAAEELVLVSLRWMLFWDD